MIKRLYVHNFRCLENFELLIGHNSSSLLIGRNGVGKSTVRDVLRKLQRIASGVNRVRDVILIKECAYGRTEIPIRFEIEVLINDELYHYQLALELPEGFKELRVAEERLSRNGVDVFSRETAQVTFAKRERGESRFVVDWHLIALPLIQVQSATDPLHIFKEWLARMLILAPIPSMISGESDGSTVTPLMDCSNLGEWFTGLLANEPSAYARIDEHIRQIMPDFKDIKNPTIGIDARRLQVQFQLDNTSLVLAFKQLSDGEKCFFIQALVLACQESNGSLFCFWDEPDNFIALDEVSHFITALRRGFHSGGQLLVTSHNPEAIRRFSPENTLFLHRHSHLEPTLVRSVEDIQFDGNLVDALIRGDVEL